MAQVKINIPGLGECDGEAAIVILGPNGSGKTQLAQKIAHHNQVSAIRHSDGLGSMTIFRCKKSNNSAIKLGLNRIGGDNTHGSLPKSQLYPIDADSRSHKSSYEEE